jgi:hypothetical protein
MYRLTADNAIWLQLENGGAMLLPATNNGTPEWRSYQAWLDAGNTPEPAFEPPAAVLPPPDYIGFSDGLLGSNAYQKIRAQGMTSTALAYAATEFSFSMTDAKAGRPNVAALQACLVGIAATATDLDATDWAEIRGLLMAHGLADTYQLPSELSSPL